MTIPILNWRVTCWALALCVAQALLSAGCAPVNRVEADPKRGSVRSVVLVNGTTQEVRDATVTYGSFQSLGGRLAPGQSKGDMGAPEAIPDRATVAWASHAGERHQKEVEVSGRVPEGFGGNIVFTIEGSGEVRVSTQKLPDFDELMASDGEEVVVSNDSGEVLQNMGVAYDGYSFHVSDMEMQRKWRYPIRKGGGFSSPRPEKVPEEATVSWELPDGSTYRRRVAVAARLPRGFSKTDKDINFRIRPDGSVLVRPADRGEGLRGGRPGPPDAATVNVRNDTAGAVEEVELKVDAASLVVPRLDAGASPAMPVGVATLPQSARLAWRGGSGQRREREVQIPREDPQPGAGPAALLLKIGEGDAITVVGVPADDGPTARTPSKPSS
jgi:hypothetical protein